MIKKLDKEEIIDLIGISAAIIAGVYNGFCDAQGIPSDKRNLEIMLTAPASILGLGITGAIQGVKNASKNHQYLLKRFNNNEYTTTAYEGFNYIGLNAAGGISAGISGFLIGYIPSFFVGTLAKILK